MCRGPSGRGDKPQHGWGAEGRSERLDGGQRHKVGGGRVDQGGSTIRHVTDCVVVCIHMCVWLHVCRPVYVPGTQDCVCVFALV